MNNFGGIAMKKKVISKMLFFLILLGTIGVYAQSFKFSLSVQNCGYTGEVKKASASDIATVMQTNTRVNGYVIEARVCNPSGYAKSSIATINGVATGYPSYSGYGVLPGDYLRLKITNPARNNASISPQGEWIPSIESRH